MENDGNSPGELFARLAGLYQKDPEEFERISKAMIRKALDKLPEKQRARGYGLQLRIEQRLKPFRDPVARMNEMVVIFWENFQKFQQIMNDPVAAAEEKVNQKSTAKIIPFRGRATRH
jgi:uncharacterized protein YicC (UPF0701 family)